ncbi:alpha/beta fold hydrolase [Seohaeicola saemankumensis]|uniref:Alpha/beta fold hydrolase n=1 Tax=Seohaeicola saemankumensis TaxID=481181 RepID=A0ABW3TFT5_9RHOB
MTWTRIWPASSDMTQDVRGGVPTHWITLGHGPRRALLIHCSLGHAGGWSRMAKALDDLMTAIAYDLPGHGRSADWDATTNIQDVSTAMAVDLLDDQAKGKPVDVVGHSFGGTVALRLAVERPDLVRSLVLVEPVFFSVAMADRPDLKVGQEPNMALYRAALAAGDRDAAAEAFASLWGDGRGWEQLPESQRQAMAARIHLIEAGHPAIYGDCAGMLSGGKLERIACPVLLIRGSDSPVAISVINDGLARRIPDAVQIEVPDAGHMVPMTHPAVVAEVIRSFWTQVPVQEPA